MYKRVYWRLFKTTEGQSNFNEGSPLFTRLLPLTISRRFAQMNLDNPVVRKLNVNLRYPFFARCSSCL